MVCPRALGRLTEVLDLLGPAAERLAPLYVSVDPGRDTPAALAAFLSRTAPAFTGLTGTVEQVEAAKESFGVFTRRAPDAGDASGYAVAHTALTYVLDPSGDYVTHLGSGLGADRMAPRLAALL